MRHILEVTMSHTEQMQIAKTILEQLGGNRFVRFTGAKNLVALESGLLFSIPKAKDSINRVRITLTPADTYTVEFCAVRGSKVKEVAKLEDVYCDMLVELFETNTGLYTHL
jgi:hypothetical protein